MSRLMAWSSCRWARRQQDLGAVDDGPRDRDALLLTAGQAGGEALLLAPEADHLEGLGHELADDVPRLADDLQRVGDVLDGLVGQQAEVLEHRAHLAAQAGHLAHGHAAEVVAGDEDGALGRGLLAQGEPEHRGLAGAEGPTTNTNSPRSMSTVTSEIAGRVDRG